MCSEPSFNERTFLEHNYYAIRGVFQLLGVFVIHAPITAWCKPHHKISSLCFMYYLVNAVILLIGTIGFIGVARKYHY